MDLGPGAGAAALTRIGTVAGAQMANQTNPTLAES